MKTQKIFELLTRTVLQISIILEKKHNSLITFYNAATPPSQTSQT